jgi:hypothetical protein
MRAIPAANEGEGMRDRWYPVPMAWFDHLRDHRERLRRRVDAVARDLRQARDETGRAMAALGLSPPAPEGDIVDVEVDPAGGAVVGAVRGLVRQTTRGLLLVVAAVLLGAALWSLGIFLGASLLAFVVVTRGLGLRIDVSPRPA